MCRRVRDISFTCQEFPVKKTSASLIALAVLPALLAMAHVGTAQASSSTRLAVDGAIIPGSCSVSLDKVSIDFGDTRSSDLQPGMASSLGSPIVRTVEVACSRPLLPTLTIADVHDGVRADDRDFVLPIDGRPDLPQGDYRVNAINARADGQANASWFSGRFRIGTALRLKPGFDDLAYPLVRLTNWKVDLAVQASAPALPAGALAEQLPFAGAFTIELGYL